MRRSSDEREGFRVETWKGPEKSNGNGMFEIHVVTPLGRTVRPGIDFCKSLYEFLAADDLYR